MIAPLQSVLAEPRRSNGQFTPIGNPRARGHIGERREGIEIATDDKPREMPPEVAHQVLSRLALFAAHRAT
jgi:hypothetical protein